MVYILAKLINSIHFSKYSRLALPCSIAHSMPKKNTSPSCRSIRVYDAERKVSKEQIEELVRAASEAPSWNNFQTSRYHVVMSDEMNQSVRLWKILPNSTKASSKD